LDYLHSSDFLRQHIGRKQTNRSRDSKGQQPGDIILGFDAENGCGNLLEIDFDRKKSEIRAAEDFPEDPEEDIGKKVNPYDENDDIPFVLADRRKKEGVKREKDGQKQ